jgi:hypothetical protein
MDSPARAEIQHLGLFIPWETFQDDNTDDLNEVWSLQKQSLEDRLLFHVESCGLIRRSAEDARVDAEAWADMLRLHIRRKLLLQTWRPMEGLESMLVYVFVAVGGLYRSLTCGAVLEPSGHLERVNIDQRFLPPQRL